MTTHIRPERAADRPAVQVLIEAAFAPVGHPAGPVIEAVLTEELRRDPAWIPELTLVAERPGAIVGQLTCSYGLLEPADAAPADRRLVGAGPVGVLPGHQRTGVGSALLQALVKTADAAGQPALVLLGSPDFYGRFGFVAAADVGILAPDPLWGRHFQVRTLSAYDRGMAGKFRYAAPFNGL